MQQDDDACRHQRGRQGTLSAWNVSTLARPLNCLFKRCSSSKGPCWRLFPPVARRFQANFQGPGRMAAYRIACKRNKAVQDKQMNSGIMSDPAAEVHSLLNLQNHVLERIFVRLHLTDLARCCQVSKSLQSLVQQEGVWQSLCADAFPNLSTAELSKWINPTPLSESQHPFQSPQQTTQPLSQISKGPQTYRSVVGCSFLKKSYSWLLSHRQLHIFAHAGNCTLC